jgi:exopolysaccharide biosynthesis predicted pyruvyltransferase EpsI
MSATLSIQPAVRSRHALLTPDAFAHVFGPLAGLRVGFVRPNGNVGDALIELAMTQLMREFGVHWRVVDPEQPCPKSIDLLVFGGGGNMGTLYRDSYDIRTKALSLGPPLVILPQSFATPEERPFERVYVRERTSLALCMNGILAPDLALGLAWPKPAAPKHDLGVFLRRDRERQGWRPWFASDPVKLCREPAEYLAMAARYRRIVTDRLHFAIAGLHAGRDVVLVANSYHKNQSMHGTWLAGLGCRFAATPAAAARLAA